MATFRNSVFKKEFDPKDDEKKVRTVGVEIETIIANEKCPLHNINRYNEEKSMEGITKNKYGYFDMDKARKKLIEHYKYGFASYGQDGNDIEIVSHPDSITLYKKGGSERFNKLMEFLKENADSTKADNSGVHVNVGKLAGDEQEYIMDNAYWIIMNFGMQIQKIAGRITHWAEISPYKELPSTCTIVEERYGESECDEDYDGDDISLYLITQKKGAQQHYIANQIKGSALVNKEFVYEFRMFKSSTDKDEVMAWVELCHNIIELASGAKPLEKIKFADLIQGEYIQKYAYALEGERKLSKVELARTVENTLEFQFLKSQGNWVL